MSVFFQELPRKIFFSSFRVHLGHTVLGAMFISNMTKTRKCLACKATFITDYRNGHRQTYCPKEGCQLARRRREQRLRRASSKSQHPLREALNGSSGLQTASPTREALLSSQSPVIIGLISTLTDSLSRKDIEETVWRLWRRGQSILSHVGSTTPRKRPKTK